MPDHKYEVIIIGGGIVGVSMAYWLARKGVKNIALLERDIMLGNGSTGRCAGGIRAQFSAEVNIKLQIEAERLFENFEREVGGKVDFIQSGYLFMVGSGELIESFKRNVVLQRSLGLAVKELTKDDIGKIAPYVDTQGVLYGTFCPTDGYADPHGATQGFAEAAKQMGARFFFQTEVKGFKKDQDAVKSVITTNGEFSASTFINCAGAWSGQVGQMAGAEIPVYPVRRMVFFTKPIPSSMELPKIIPMTIDMDSGFYMRREGDGLLLGMEDDSEPAGFNETLRWDWLEVLIEKAVQRVPLLKDAQIMRGWAGLYDQSPDHSAVMGKVPGFKNFYVISGFSGHGFMQGPIAAKLVAEEIVDGRTSIDISALRVDRFKDGELVKEANVI